MRKMDGTAHRFATYQARIFGDSVMSLDCSSKVFLRRYIKSNFARLIMDSFDITKVTFSPVDAFRALDEEYGGPTHYGHVKYGYDQMYWLGYVTSAMVYMFGSNTRVLNSLIPFNELITHFHVYHTQSVEWVAERVLEEKGLREEDLNIKARFRSLVKQAIIRDLERSNKG